VSDDAIYNAFAVRLGEFAQAHSLPVSYPGVPFDAPESGRWLEGSWIPNGSQNYGMADDAPTLIRGLAQVNVCERPGGGIVGGLALAKQVVDHFAKGTRFDIARIYEKPSVSNLIEETARVMYAVTIRWHGFDNGS
jgi:hypothetical protein